MRNRNKLERISVAEIDDNIYQSNTIGSYEELSCCSRFKSLCLTVFFLLCTLSLLMLFLVFLYDPSKKTKSNKFWSRYRDDDEMGPTIYPSETDYPGIHTVILLKFVMDDPLKDTEALPTGKTGDASVTKSDNDSPTKKSETLPAEEAGNDNDDPPAENTETLPEEEAGIDNDEPPLVDSNEDTEIEKDDPLPENSETLPEEEAGIDNDEPPPENSETLPEEEAGIDNDEPPPENSDALPEEEAGNDNDDSPPIESETEATTTEIKPVSWL